MTKNKPIKKSSAKKKAESSVVIDNTKLQLILAWEEVKQEYDKILKKSAKNIKAQGFRQGKIPLKIAEEKLGRNRIINQVLETLVPQKYQDLIKKEKKKPLTSPEVKPISINWGQDWELEIQIAEKPLIKLSNYQKSIKKA
ncbi:MAG: trigger factor family protein [Patescibacteria group bacterium]